MKIQQWSNHAPKALGLKVWQPQGACLSQSLITTRKNQSSLQSTLVAEMTTQVAYFEMIQKKTYLIKVWSQ